MIIPLYHHALFIIECMSRVFITHKFVDLTCSVKKHSFPYQYKYFINADMSKVNTGIEKTDFVMFSFCHVTVIYR